MKKGTVKKTYSKQFKIDLVERIQQGEFSASDVARKHGINPSIVYKWCELYDRGLIEPDIQESQTEKHLRMENRQLKEKLAELFMKLEHLKKLEIYTQRRRSVATSVITGANLDQFKKPVNS